MEKGKRRGDVAKCGGAIAIDILVSGRTNPWVIVGGFVYIRELWNRADVGGGRGALCTKANRECRQLLGSDLVISLVATVWLTHSGKALGNRILGFVGEDVLVLLMFSDF